MQLLYLLEKIRNPVFDFLFSLLTHIGEETFFLLIAILFFWCVNKKEGYFILVAGFFGTLINQTLKLLCRVPRPWVKDPSFTIVESARAEATGYSFPSGHTQNAASTFGAITAYNRKKPITIICISVIAVVALSRMYLGVHTPWDVLVSLVIGLGLILLLSPIFESEERFNRFMPYVVGAALLLSMLYLVYVEYIVDPATHESINYRSALKNAYTMFGCTLGLVLTYAFDVLYIKFDTRAPWYAQILKAAIGLAIIFAIKSLLSSPLTSLFGNEYVARTFRYFLIVVFGGVIWPLTFPLFARMKVKFLDDLGTRVACFFSASYRERHEAEVTEQARLRRREKRLNRKRKRR